MMGKFAQKEEITIEELEVFMADDHLDHDRAVRELARRIKALEEQQEADDEKR